MTTGRRAPAIASALVSAMLIGSPAAPALAQTPTEPTIVLTIYAGAITGHGLWSVPRQPLVVEGTEGAPIPEFDTLDLRRNVSAGLTLGLRGAYFIRRHLGIELDISYLDNSYDDVCVGTYVANADDRNEQVCGDIDGRHSSGSIIAAFGGFNLRAWGDRNVSPFVRAAIGVANITRSSVDVSGTYVRSDGAIRDRAVIVDTDPRRLSPAFLIGAGISSRFARGYQVRLDVRDVIVGLDEVDGPADIQGRAPVSTRYHHRFVLTLGLDIVLEKRRGRRY
jgi:hypothetical protein